MIYARDCIYTQMVDSSTPATTARVACCIAGAWRDWAFSWRYIEPNIVEALDADVYAVSDTVIKTPGTHGRTDPSFTIERMRAVFGRRFRAGEQLSDEHMSNVSGHTWDGVPLTSHTAPAPPAPHTHGRRLRRAVPWHDRGRTRAGGARAAVQGLPVRLQDMAVRPAHRAERRAL